MLAEAHLKQSSASKLFGSQLQFLCLVHVSSFSSVEPKSQTALLWGIALRCRRTIYFCALSKACLLTLYICCWPARRASGALCYCAACWQMPVFLAQEAPSVCSPSLSFHSAEISLFPKTPGVIGA